MKEEEKYILPKEVEEFLKILKIKPKKNTHKS